MLVHKPFHLAKGKFRERHCFVLHHKRTTNSACGCHGNTQVTESVATFSFFFFFLNRLCHSRAKCRSRLPAKTLFSVIFCGLLALIQMFTLSLDKWFYLLTRQGKALSRVIYLLWRRYSQSSSACSAAAACNAFLCRSDDSKLIDDESCLDTSGKRREAALLLEHVELCHTIYTPTICSVLQPWNCNSSFWAVYRNYRR